MTDPGRDPHQRATRQMVEQARHAENTREVVRALEAAGAPVATGLVCAMLIARELPQAFHRGTYVLQRSGERYPCGHTLACSHTEAVLRLERRFGNVSPDEVRRVR